MLAQARPRKFGGEISRGRYRHSAASIAII
jgi:hypothetical protein